MKAILRGCVSIPKDYLDMVRVKKELTCIVYDVGEEKEVKVPAYTMTRTHIEVPRQYGLDLCQRFEVNVEDRTSLGYELPADLKAINLWDYQEPFVEGIVDRFESGMEDMIAVAATGKGKTVMGLEAARRLGRTTLIIVDQEFLRDQWVERLTDPNLMHVPKDKIGVIQGKNCEVEGKWFVVAMIQTLFSRDLPQEVYDYFGTVIVDEAHTAGAPQFSKALMLFSAAYRFGVTATPDRGDALQEILHWNLGQIEVELTAKHRKSIVRYVEYDGVLSWYANSSNKTGRYLSELSNDGRRNLLAAQMIKSLYDTGREVLAVSDRIEHLENVVALCIYLGVPEEEVGLICGYEHTWKYAKDINPPRKPEGLEPGSEYTPVSLQQIKKRIPKATLEHRKNNCKIRAATYGMFTKGVDVPTLSAGVDLTPRAKAVQVHGRILRAQDNKLIPIWATIRDVMSYRAEHQFLKRIEEYVESNAEVYLWRPGKGVKKRDIRELKREVRINHQDLKDAEIITAQDGRNIVVMRE